MNNDLNSILNKEFFKYGFLPMLVVLDRMKQLEEFEICNQIVNLIKDINKKLELELPTQYNIDAILEFKITFMLNHNSTGDVAFKNTEHYADEIIKSIDQWKQQNKTK